MLKVCWDRKGGEEIVTQLELGKLRESETGLINMPKWSVKFLCFEGAFFVSDYLVTNDMTISELEGLDPI